MSLNEREAKLKRLLDTRAYDRALLMTEQLLLVNPTDERFHLILGRLYELVDENYDFITVVEKVVDRVPAAYTSRLMLGREFQKRHNNEAAFQHFVMALKTANNHGFWLNNESTAPWCRRFVMDGVNFVEQHRRDVMNLWLEELEDKFGRSDIDRVRQGVRMYSGDIPTAIEDPRQAPSFLYIPGLPNKPVFDRSDLDFIDYYENCFPLIRDDFNELIERKVKIDPYVGGEEKHGLTEGGDWDAMFFYRHGEKYDETHEVCPNTSRVLNDLPVVFIKDHSPEICFSVLRPQAHLLPHRGVTNSRSVLHMGLDIPPSCALNIVDIAQISWTPGKAFAFDDTYLHEAWNHSDRSRYVLLTDIWNPFLSEAECSAISFFVEKVGLLNNQHQGVSIQEPK